MQKGSGRFLSILDNGMHIQDSEIGIVVGQFYYVLTSVSEQFPANLESSKFDKKRPDPIGLAFSSEPCPISTPKSISGSTDHQFSVLAIFNIFQPSHVTSFVKSISPSFSSGNNCIFVEKPKPAPSCVSSNRFL